MSDTCPVCYSNLTIKNVMNLKCNHQLCRNCYYNWTDNQCKNSCPCCRGKIYTKEIDKRLDEIYVLKDEKTIIQNDIYSLRKNVIDIEEDRNNLIYETVKYGRKVKENIQKLEDQEYEFGNQYDKLEELKKYQIKIKANIPNDLTDNPRKLAIHFKNVSETYDKTFDNSMKDLKYSMVRSLKQISKNKDNFKMLLKSSIETSFKTNKRREYDETDIPIGDTILFENDIEEYEEEDEDIDWTFDSNVFSDSDISEMPELEDVETTFSEDELEYDRAALNVQYSIRHHTHAYNVDNYHFGTIYSRRVRNIEDV